MRRFGLSAPLAIGAAALCAALTAFNVSAQTSRTGSSQPPPANRSQPQPQDVKPPAEKQDSMECDSWSTEERTGITTFNKWVYTYAKEQAVISGETVKY